ncbi:MAG: hypothetical protein Q9212_002916 [Teloschistes hypoglaucus]
MNQTTYSLPPPRLEPRDSLFPFLADHHLPYVVPAVFYWIISFVFHFINKQDLLLKYKLHTSAEDLTKNRASRRDVIKFALIQQAAQCLLGYLTADDTERFMPPEYAVTLWAQRLRSMETVCSQWIRYAANIVPWVIYRSNLSELSTFRKAMVEGPSNYLIGGVTQTLGNPSHHPVPFSALDMCMGKAMYWILYPMFQYLLAMSVSRPERV